MKIKDALENYYFHSGKASDNVRQLAFAGIAVIWIFKIDLNGSPKLPPELLLPLVLIAVGLAADLFQYYFAAVCWGFYHRWKEQQVQVREDTDFKAPHQLNWPGLVCYHIKIFTIIGGYYYILKFLVGWLIST